MWIAKPIEAISASEKQIWEGIASQFGILSQSWAWAEAMLTVGGRPCFVFSPDEKVGGLIFRSKSSTECINGPLLHWDQPPVAIRQFATFAMAISKLDRTESELIAKPRWLKRELTERLQALPLQHAALHESATLELKLDNDPENPFSEFHPRLKRTLQKNRPYLQKNFSQSADPASLERFVPLLREFGARKGFAVPPLSWFLTLAAHLPTFLSFAKVADHEDRESECEILIGIQQCADGPKAHYLFGREQRTTEAPGWMSSSAFAHRLAIEECIRRGVRVYDWNGYQTPNTAPNPCPAYQGVCRFKEQFGGHPVEYANPEFRLQLK